MPFRTSPVLQPSDGNAIPEEGTLEFVALCPSQEFEEVFEKQLEDSGAILSSFPKLLFPLNLSDGNAELKDGNCEFVALRGAR